MYICFNVNLIYTQKKENHRNGRPKNTEKKIPFQNARKNPSLHPPFKGAQKNGNEGFFNNRVHRCERLISQLNNTEALCSSFTPIDPPTWPFPSVWPIVRTIEIPFSTVADPSPSPSAAPSTEISARWREKRRGIPRCFSWSSNFPLFE